MDHRKPKQQKEAETALAQPRGVPRVRGIEVIELGIAETIHYDTPAGGHRGREVRHRRGHGSYV